MAIDDPKKAFEEQYLGEEAKSPLSLALFASKLALPKVGFLLDIFNKVYDRFQKPTVEERIKAMFRLLVQETEHQQSKIDDLNSSKVNADDLQEAIQLAIRHDAEEFNDKKRERYVKMIGNALQSENKVEDLARFIQTVEQLGERDLLVLKVLNKVMNQEGDWRNESGPVTLWKIHPGVFTHRRQELGRQVAEALGQRTEPRVDTFDHEAGYEVCARLQGFGLAHEVPVSAREVPIGDYCFRISARGILLLKFLGEDVPNFDKYFGS